MPEALFIGSNMCMHIGLASKIPKYFRKLLFCVIDAVRVPNRFCLSSVFIKHSGQSWLA